MEVGYLDLFFWRFLLTMLVIYYHTSPSTLPSFTNSLFFTSYLSTCHGGTWTLGAPVDSLRVKPGIRYQVKYRSLRVKPGRRHNGERECCTLTRAVFDWNRCYYVTMGTHVSFIFRGYNPYIGGLKPLLFMVLGSKGIGIKLKIHVFFVSDFRSNLGFQDCWKIHSHK